MASDNLIEELQDDLRQERLHALWKEYGPYIIAGIVLAVILTGIISGYRSWDEKVSTAQTAVLLEALNAGDESPAALNKAAADLRPGPRALAWLSAGGILIEQGKQEEALAVYNKAVVDDDLPAVYRDLARLLSVRLEWALEKPETQAKALLEKLTPLTTSDKSPWQAQARLQAGVIAANGLKDYALAHKYLSTVIATENAPDTLREKARALDAVYQADAAKAGGATVQEKPEG